jgi:hypothetical protein
MSRDENIGERLTVGELIEILQQFPRDMGVVDYTHSGIVSARIYTWTHNNYPYNLPDTDYVMLE